MREINIAGIYLVPLSLVPAFILGFLKNSLHNIGDEEKVPLSSHTPTTEESKKGPAGLGQDSS